MAMPPAGPIAAILAHPDDIKSVSGTALMAMERGNRVSLILVTKGEALDLAVDPIRMGTRRIKELRRFLESMNIPDRDFFQLGVPDGSAVLPAMRDDFYEARGKPFFSDLLGTNRVTYRDAYRPGMPYFGESLVSVLRSLLRRIHPRTVLTHHPRDAHADHRAVSFFARKACVGLRPAIRFTLVYAQGFRWPPKGPNFYNRALGRRYPGLKARQVILPPRILARKRKTCRNFMPILGTAYINSYMKRDEILWSRSLSE